MLKDLYEDVKEQLFDSFEWVIVDNGRTDDTEKLMQLWIKEIRMNIKKNI
jgi:glycosyltransferase involved in cell wall biosynthesis